MSYFDRPGLSFHSLKDLGTISPEYYYRRHVTKELAGFSSANMAFGTAVHAAILEPDTYQEQVTIAPAEFITPGGALSTAKAAKEWRESLPPYACVLTPFDHARAQYCAERVRNNPLARKILANAAFETEHTREIGFGIQSKCKVDIIDATKAVWDLKTIKSLDDITDHARDFCYVEQIDWYAYLTGGTSGGLLVVESEEPHRVAMVCAGNGLQEKARTRWQGWLAKYQECQIAGEWPNDPIEPIILHDL